MDWQPIETARRDGTWVNIKDDEGRVRRGKFAAPCWWTLGTGSRIADGDLYKGDLDIYRAIEWRPLKGDE